MHHYFILFFTWIDQKRQKKKKMNAATNIQRSKSTNGGDATECVTAIKLHPTQKTTPTKPVSVFTNSKQPYIYIFRFTH